MRIAYTRQIAFTATPEYYIAKSLEAAGYKQAYALSVVEAQRRHILAPHRNIILDINDIAFSLRGIDVSATDGDYDTAAVDKVINQTKLHHIISELLLSWRDPVTKRSLRDMTGVIACNSVEHAQNFAGILNQRRLSRDYNPTALCMPIWGSMPQKAKEKLIEAHKSGEVRALAFEKLLLTGYDNPLIEYIINIAPTRSMVRAGQRGGRVLRQFRDRSPKTGFVFDITYPGSRNDQICFSDFVGGFALDAPPSPETERNVEKDIEKTMRDHPALDQVRVFYTDGQLKRFVRQREIDRALDKHPTLREINPSIRDRMIFKKIFSIPDLVNKVHTHPKVVQWRLDNPYVFKLVTKNRIDDFIKNPSARHFVASFDRKKQYIYHPTAVAIATFFGVPAKDIFGKLPDFEGYAYSQDRIDLYKKRGVAPEPKDDRKPEIYPATLDELLSGHYHNLREDSCPYTEDGEPVDMSETKPSRFPFALGVTDTDRPFDRLTGDVSSPLISAFYTKSPLEGVTQEEFKRVVAETLLTLSPKEESILRNRFFQDKTLDDIGQEKGLSKERIRQIHSQALRRLRHPVRSEKLLPFQNFSNGKLTVGGGEG